MSIERIANQQTTKNEQSQRTQDAQLQQQFAETTAQFMVSMAQQQGQRALEGMAEARNEEG